MRSLIIYLLITALFSFSGYSQTAIKYSTINSGGARAENGNVAIEQTIGELMVREQTQGKVSLSEGFIHPDILISLGVDDDYLELKGVKVYPNPVSDKINVYLPEVNAYLFYLYDTKGRQLISKESAVKKMEINIAGLPAGTYLLIVMNRKDKKVTTIKIQKR